MVTAYQEEHMTHAQHLRLLRTEYSTLDAHMRRAELRIEQLTECLQLSGVPVPDF